jgi:hypothetical protein
MTGQPMLTRRLGRAIAMIEGAAFYGVATDFGARPVAGAFGRKPLGRLERASLEYMTTTN